MKTVALPLETKVREYYGKLWLGLNLAERGYRSVIGPSYEIDTTLDISEPDIYLSKDPGDGSIDFFDRLRSSGIIVCGLDTEGKLASSLDRFLKNNRIVLNHIDALFTWGPIHKEKLSEIYKTTDNVYVTGNPRFDLLYKPLSDIYNDEASKIQNQFSDYILFTSSFSDANPFDYKQFRKKQTEVLGEFDTTRLNYIIRNYYRFLECIMYVQKNFPEMNIVLRPHPGEDQTVYDNLDDWYDNIHVRHTGDVRSWILGAESVIHFNCTTGVESALMKTPVISYEPINENKDKKYLPQIVSRSVSDLDDLQNQLSNWLSNKNKYTMTSEQQNHARKYLGQLNSSAADNICDLIDAFSYQSNKKYSELRPDPLQRFERNIRVTKFSNYASLIYNIFTNDYDIKQLLEQNKVSKADQKFPGLDKKEIKEDIKKFVSSADISAARVKKVDYTNNTYYIIPK